MRLGILTCYLALSSDSDSGIGLHYRVLADALVAQGHQVHVVYLSPRPDCDRIALAALNPRWGCDIIDPPKNKFIGRLLRASWPTQILVGQMINSIKAAVALTDAVRRHRLEIIETHATGFPGLAYLGLSGGAPLVTRLSTTAAQLHANLGVSSTINQLAGQLERFFVRSSSSKLTHSRRHRDEIVHQEAYCARDFTLIPHGLPDLAPRPEIQQEEENRWLDILFVGRFEPRKGVDVLLEAVPTVLAANPRARFILAGSYKDDATWPDFATRHPELAGDRVRALGRVSADELNRLYNSCVLFVAPSRYESFGLIYVEAMRHAKPVIGCRVGGVADVIDHEETGLLVPSGDVPGLTFALNRLLSDPELRFRMGQAGRNHFLRRFSDTKMAGSSAAHYAEVLAAESPRPI